MAAEFDDDILERRASHPETTTMLIVCAVALLVAIILSAQELSNYVNPRTRRQLSNFNITAVDFFHQEFPEQGEPEGSRY